MCVVTLASFRGLISAKVLGLNLVNGFFFWVRLEGRLSQWFFP